MAVQHQRRQDHEQADHHQQLDTTTTCRELEPLSTSRFEPTPPLVASTGELPRQDPSSSLWWRGVFLTDKMRSFLFFWILVLLVLHVASGGQRDDPSASANNRGPVSVKHYDANPISFDSRICSRVCQCEGSAVDCSNRGLTQIPADLPKDADKM